MNCQILFSGKKRRHISKFRLLIVFTQHAKGLEQQVQKCLTSAYVLVGHKFGPNPIVSNKIFYRVY